MTTVKRFEDLDVWQKARELASEIYKVSSTGDYAHDSTLKNQTRRAAVSIVSNIAEGFERDGNKEFRQHLSVAKGSAGELRAQLCVSFDVGFLSEETFERLSTLANDIGCMIGGLMRYLESTEVRGRKFK